MKILEQQERQLHDFSIRSDGKTAMNLLHADFIEIGYSGKTYTYDSTINALKKEEKPDYKIHSQDYYITESSDTFVQLLYKTAHISEDGYVSRYAKRSSIWVLQDDTWKMKYHQATPSNDFNIQK